MPENIICNALRLRESGSSEHPPTHRASQSSSIACLTFPLKTITLKETKKKIKMRGQKIAVRGGGGGTERKRKEEIKEWKRVRKNNKKEII